MAGLYIHIPFCLRRCAYCDFYSQTDETIMDRYVDAVCREIEMRSCEVDSTLSTIYFGGGTPSQLSLEHIVRLFETIQQYFVIDPDAEITFESNPDDLTPTYIQQLRTTPINRLSIGIQSFDNDDLRLLLRRHTSMQAKEAVWEAYRTGFTNISVDLIYALPGQTLEKWHSNLEQVFSLPINHLSAYHLTYEEGTVLHRRLLNGAISEVSEEVSVEMFYLLRRESERAGLIHYEISNFGRPGLFSKHNSSYWMGTPYLGVGTSAHSFDGVRRSVTIADVGTYIHTIEKDELPVEREDLTQSERINDYIITRLRTMWGVSLVELATQFGPEVADLVTRKSNRYIHSGDIIVQNDCLILTPQGMLRSDGIIVELFVE